MKYTLIKRVHLMAESPRKAFYDLSLERITDGYLVRKQSGGNGKVLSREAWFRETLGDAEALFNRIVKEKTNPGRKSKRKYVERYSVPGIVGKKRGSLYENGRPEIYARP